MGGFSLTIMLMAMASIFYGALLLGIILIIAKFILYVFECFGIMKLNDNMEYSHSWTAWVPVYHKFLLGRVGKEPQIGICLCIFSLIKWILFFAAVFTENNYLWLSWIGIMLVTFILEMITLHKVYKIHTKYNEVFTVLSIISVGILEPIFLFVIRNKKEIK